MPGVRPFKGPCSHQSQAAQVLSSIINSTDPAIQNAQSQTTRASVRHSILENCPACSTKYLDIKRTGISGCPVCWNTWGPLLYSKGRKKGYRGKYPQSSAVDNQSIPQQQLFEEQLKKAIATEDYEKAAYYRDRIQQLKLDRE